MKTRLIFFSVALIICGLGYFQQRNREAQYRYKDTYKIVYETINSTNTLCSIFYCM